MPRDPGDDAHYTFVRRTKAALGIIFALTAGWGVYMQADVKVILGMAIMGGMMLDAPSITALVSQVVKAIPWSKNGTGEKS